MPIATTTEQIYGTKEHPYSTLPETKEDLPWADLISLDLSTFDESGGKQKLADQLKWAVHNVGFFYVVGFGIPWADVDEQFAIGKQVFDLPLEEKISFGADVANGGYNGYTGPDLPHFKDNGIARRKNVEVFNLPKFEPRFDAWHAAHRPTPVAENWDKIVKFGKAVHTNVVERLLVIFALVLGLEDENAFVKTHRYNEPSEDHLRYMKYGARTKEENDEARGLYGGGHTDLGSVTLLFRQPIAALQVRREDGVWQWVKPHPESITVNIADTLQLLSGEYLKSSVHRVSVPPADQAQFDRIGVLYFVRPENHVPVEVVQGSKVLEEEGVYKRLAEEEEREGKRPPLTVEQWVKAKQADIFSKEASARYAKLIAERGTAAAEGKERRDLETRVAGVKVKYYA